MRSAVASRKAQQEREEDIQTLGASEGLEEEVFKHKERAGASVAKFRQGKHWTSITWVCTKKLDLEE